MVDPSALTGRPYTVSFGVGGGVTTYTVMRSNASGPATTVAGGTYSDPTDAAVRRHPGRPHRRRRPTATASTIEPAGFQSIFDSIAQAIDALKQPTAGHARRRRANCAPRWRARRPRSTGALDHVLLKRADMGAALAELDAYGSLNDDRKLEYRDPPVRHRGPRLRQGHRRTVAPPARATEAALQQLLDGVEAVAVRLLVSTFACTRCASRIARAPK
ncbi:MAG: hypothetical protein MZW92_54355 [Comamonadaceae bacterium]|nr:hypothetical protein [Comamonadaceae bacterium]